MNRKDYLDIIFKGFEKNYGAYIGRVQAGSRTGISFMITLGLMLGVLLPMIPKKMDLDKDGSNIKVKHTKVIQYSQLSAPPPIETVKMTPPKKRPPRAKVKVASKKFVKPTVKPDEEVEKVELLPSQEELKFVNPGKITQEGDSLHQLTDQSLDQDEVEIQYDLEETEVVKTEERAPAPKPKDDNTVYTFTEQQASFPGGPQKLYQYLSKNLIYPPIALDNEIEGRAVLQFIVEKDGRISDIEILRDPGGGCGKEAVRVVSEMPPWEAAVQNEIKVRSKFVLPVVFKIFRPDEG